MALLISCSFKNVELVSITCLYVYIIVIKILTDLVLEVTCWWKNYKQLYPWMMVFGYRLLRFWLIYVLICIQRMKYLSNIIVIFLLVISFIKTKIACLYFVYWRVSTTHHWYNHIHYQTHLHFH